jgi:hypothetical protein
LSEEKSPQAYVLITRLWGAENTSTIHIETEMRAIAKLKRAVKRLKLRAAAERMKA